MTDIVLEQRVTKLEEAMAALAQETTRLAREMLEFKDEMREFKDEMREFKDEMREFKDEMREFKDETRANWATRDAELQAYRREWRAEFESQQQAWQAEFERQQQAWRSDFERHREKSEAETQALRREFNKQQGEIANRLGTLAEDLVAPSLPRILMEITHCPSRDKVAMAVRVRRPHPTEPGQNQEYDVIVSCGQYALFNETKTRLRPADVDRLIERLERVRPYFPEYATQKILGSLASLYVDPSLVQYANRQGVLILATGDELMEVINEPGLTLREF